MLMLSLMVHRDAVVADMMEKHGHDKVSRVIDKMKSFVIINDTLYKV